MDKTQAQNLSREELQKQLPALHTWAELTRSLMLKCIDWNKHEYGPYQNEKWHQPQAIEVPRLAKRQP